MKRKKFIKMLMWAGMSRNDAADCATLAQNAERPYFWVLGDLLNFHRQDFGNPLAWMKMRRTIIHGHNSSQCRLWRDMDEVHKMDGSAVAEILEQGAAAKPGPVVILTSSTAAPWSSFDWTPQPQPVAGYLLAIDLSQGEDMTAQWTKKNPAYIPDVVDAIADALNARRILQREVLAR